MKKLLILLLFPVFGYGQGGWNNVGNALQRTTDGFKYRFSLGSQRGVWPVYGSFQTDSAEINNGYAPQNASFNITRSGAMDSTLTINSGFSGYNTVIFSRHDNTQTFEIQQNGATVIKYGQPGFSNVGSFEFLTLGNSITHINNLFGSINLTGNIGAVNGSGIGTYLNNTVLPGANGDTIAGLVVKPNLTNGTPITSLKNLVGGIGYADGSYNVNFNSGSHYGGTATLTVSGGTVTLVTLTNGGYNYAPNDVLTAVFGGGSGFSVTVNTVGAYTGTIHIGTMLYNGVLIVPITFSQLPVVLLEGTHFSITDSNTNTYGATITGGGSFHVPAYYNGVSLVVD